MELVPQAARCEKRPLSSTMTGGDLRVVGSLDRYSNCQGHKDEDEDKMNLHGLSRRSSAFDEAVQADVLSAALHDRFRSYEEHTFAQKVLSPTRQGFGGHNEAKSHGSNRMEDKA